ncbi:MFS transporter [Streptomyces sp. NEAU-YJ-81]|uniref:MFS transporter n=1 Tax=Streptomyces sp. NEAU-YJ-81 TaxID=2820288 RepID=UPI001FB8D79D|nr:MFS transporter [Streptomyces sp. NEAU-YJ-81]
MIFLASLMVLTAGAYLPSPLYPDYQRLFGYDDLVMTLLFATFALAGGPALLLCGPAADIVGHRPVPPCTCCSTGGRGHPRSPSGC